ncbi:MAG: glycosyltransferase [bacterium]|nr:glycosyltransferase [bacterium]
MRILTYTAPGAVLPHTLNDIRDALVGMGHEVYVQDLVEIAAAGSGAHALDVAICDGLAVLTPDLVLTVDTAGLVPAYLATTSPESLVASWFYDDPVEILDAKGMRFSLLGQRYHVFSWDHAYLPELRRRGFVHCHYLPFATNPHVHYPREPAGFDFDVSFVGHATETRAQLLIEIAAAGFEVDVFGDEAWAGLKHPRLHFHGAANNRHGCPRVYSGSRVNLNVTNAQLHTSLPVRVFDVLACEGFLLTDARGDTERLFRDGEHLAIYNGRADLLEKLEHYLGNPEERRRIASLGRRRVLERHTFSHQLRELLGLVAEAPAAPLIAEPEGGDAALGLWLGCLAKLKLGRLDESQACLDRVLKLLPSDENVKLAQEALCEAGRGDWISEDWSQLYRGLDVDLDDDGRVFGWQPLRYGDRESR